MTDGSKTDTAGLRDIETPTLVVSDSLLLRPAEIDDAESYYGLVAANFDRLSEWLHVPRPAGTVEERRKLMAADLDGGKGRSRWWLVEVDGELAGTIAFHNLSYRDGWTLVGYWLAEGFTGRGIMSASLKIIIDWAFSALKLARVEIHSAVTNRASCAIPERLGIRREAIRRRTEIINGTSLDMASYAAFADNWPPKPPEKPLPARTIEVDSEILLRPIAETDEQAMWQAIDGDREYLGKYLPWIDTYPTAESHLSQFTQRRVERDVFDRSEGYLVEYRGELAGTVGFGFPNRDNGVEVGYWLRQDLQGRGIITRSIEAVITMLIVEMGLHRVTIRAATTNLPSRGIPERLGFTHEGTMRDGALVNGEYLDLEIYSMLDHEWLARSGNA